jgi:hypothetical protein
MDHQTLDKISLERHRLIARKIDKNPEWGISIVLGNIRRWKKIGRHDYFDKEWKKILETRDWPKIRKFMLSRSEIGQQVRQATPFCGILTEEERMKIYRKYAEKWRIEHGL